MSLSWIPNAISALRIILIAPLLVLLVQGEYGWVLLLFCIAGFSDGLDGYLAVRFSWQTRLGALLDPIADKLLVAGMFITLTSIHLIPLWLTVAVLARDVVIVAGATAYQLLIEPVAGEPTNISKLNTALQMLFLLFVVSRAAFGWPAGITITVLGAATFVTVCVSGIDYVLRWSGRARKGAST
ncbi:MAG TPA: CDP-alcohol phosphatidyltransferase family protein [Woeseiaceae bacterium]|nr:CDP-alcohol phosphatidyltransferase family protein [Woeseiaceae bacterium]